MIGAIKMGYRATPASIMCFYYFFALFAAMTIHYRGDCALWKDASTHKLPRDLRLLRLTFCNQQPLQSARKEKKGGRTTDLPTNFLPICLFHIGIEGGITSSFDLTWSVSGKFSIFSHQNKTLLPNWCVNFQLWNILVNTIYGAQRIEMRPMRTKYW